MRVFRISNCNYIDDLSGKGAAMYGGRWNSKGTYILYTASTASLALLETVVHFTGLPQQGFCLLELDIPGSKQLVLDEKKLSTGWRSYPSPAGLKKLGDDFIKKGEFLSLKIPSAVFPEEFNFLLNPLHPDFKKIRIIRQKPFTLDQRLIH